MPGQCTRRRYRSGRILLAGDAAHQFPATGIGINVGMLDAVNLAWKLAADIGGWAPAGLLDTYHDERHFAGAREMLQTQAQVALHTDQGSPSIAQLMRAARPVFLDLADRPDLRETARDWRHRVDIQTTTTSQRPADALLIRPDAYIAWAAPIDEPASTAAPALREALGRWFGRSEPRT